MTSLVLSPTDFDYMGEALRLAAKAASEGEVPVGAVVVYQDRIIGRGYNRPIALCDPSAHAEMMALREAAQVLSNYRLPEAELFVTLEPCVMCVGVIQHARIRRVVFGASDLKTGACGSAVDVLRHNHLNHHVKEVVGGMREAECIACLRDFFRERRLAQKNNQSKE
jgi:tRNA(adenine34) deaminase